LASSSPGAAKFLRGWRIGLILVPFQLFGAIFYNPHGKPYDRSASKCIGLLSWDGTSSTPTQAGAKQPPDFLRARNFLPGATSE
jgi:hypothetical protein